MSSELRVDKIIPTSGVPTNGGGGVIQVVSASTTSDFSTNSTSYVDITGCTVNITPKFSTSKIYVTMQGGRFGMYSNASYYSNVQLVRDSTVLTYGLPSDRGSNSNGNACGQGALSFLDSPATTSQITYKAQVKSSSSSGTVYPTNSGTGLTIVAMEVSA